MELVNADVESDQLDTLTDSMFAQAGFGNKEELTFDDFRAVMAEYKDSLEDAQLDFTGMQKLSNIFLNNSRRF